ncbi:MAG TPA: hypothetical protein VGP72_13615 [Planctomycetota bacterium]|jgi:hypothetical protein
MISKPRSIEELLSFMHKECPVGKARDLVASEKDPAKQTLMMLGLAYLALIEDRPLESLIVESKKEKQAAKA